MKTKIFKTAIILILSSNCIFPQDIMVKNNGDELQVKVFEINATEVKFKKFDNQDGPIFIVPKSEIFMIKYENGQKEIMEKVNITNKLDEPQNNGTDFFMMGKNDATLFYTGKNSGALWTSFTTGFCSPVIGVIPAVACALSEPTDKNLNINSNLAKNRDYYQGYVNQAHKIKKRKVWTAFGIGSASWFVLLLINTYIGS